MKIYYVKFALHCILATGLVIFVYIFMRKLASIELIPWNSVMPSVTIFSIISCMTCISDNLKALEQVNDDEKKLRIRNKVKSIFLTVKSSGYFPSSFARKYNKNTTSQKNINMI